LVSLASSQPPSSRLPTTVTCSLVLLLLCFAVSSRVEHAPPCRCQLGRARSLRLPRTAWLMANRALHCRRVQSRTQKQPAPLSRVASHDLVAGRLGFCLCRPGRVATSKAPDSSSAAGR